MSELQPGWDYKKNTTPLVSVADTDRLISVVLSAGTTWAQTIIAAVQLILFLAYVWLRKSLMDEQMMLARQDYEQARVNRNRDELARDDLDSPR